MTAKTRADLNTEADTNLADNTTGDISPADVRGMAKNLADSMGTLKDENQALEGGAAVTPKDLGTKTTGTITVDVGDCPMHEMVMNGSIVLDVENYGHTGLDIEMGASASAIDTDAFDKVDGSFTYTSGDKFSCFIKNGPAGSVLQIVAMQ